MENVSMSSSRHDIPYPCAELWNGLRPTCVEICVMNKPPLTHWPLGNLNDILNM